MINAVIEELKTHQTQLDQDGVMVGVSRQALEELLAHIAKPAHPAPIAGLEPVAWRSPTDVPSIELGSSRELILAVYRKHSDKVYSFAAEYLNGYPLRYEYGCPKEKDGVCDGCGDGCPTTGWYYVEGADDDGYTYHALSLDDGDEIKGWRELPQWGEDQFTRAQLDAHAAEQVRAERERIAVSCCGWITHVQLGPHAHVRPDQTGAQFAARLICRRCGQRPDDYRIERGPTYGYKGDLSNLLSYRPRRD